MSLVKKWQALPRGKQGQLSSNYGIRWFGISDEDLEKELEEKLPSGFFDDVIVPKENPVKEDKKDDAEKEEDFSKLTNFQLRKIAKERGIEGGAKMNKAALLAALEA